MSSKPSQTAASAIANQPRSAFLGLPQEIRDQVYTHVFEQAPMILSWEAMRLLCSLSFHIPSTNTSIEPSTTQKGLPSWIQACKQILYEAADFISRTHTFQRFALQDSGETTSKLHNPLIFSNHGIRRIALCRLVKISVEIESEIIVRRADATAAMGTDIFLQALKKTDARDIDLEIHWERGLCRSRLPLQDTAFFFSPDEIGDWAGRFRKVMLGVTVLDERHPESVLGPLMERAEQLARKLVGLGGSVCCQDRTQEWVPDIMGYKSQRVTVERKLG